MFDVEAAVAIGAQLPCPAAAAAAGAAAGCGTDAAGAGTAALPEGADAMSRYSASQ